MAINDVLPLKAARRDAIVNSKCLRASDTRDLISTVTFTFSIRRHLIRFASAPFISPRLVGFGFRVQRVESTMQNLRKVGENFDPIVKRLWTKVHEFFRRFPDFPWLSVSRFLLKKFAVKVDVKLPSRRKTPKTGSSSSQVLEKRQRTPNFRHIFSNLIHFITCAKFWFSCEGSWRNKK